MSKTYTWNEEQIALLKSGKVTSVFGASSAYCQKMGQAFDLHDADLARIDAPTLHFNPVWVGGGYVMGKTGAQMQTAALGYCDPASMLIKAEKPVQLEFGTRVAESLDGKHVERAERMAELTESVKDELSRNGSLSELEELLALRTKDCAQRYEALIQLRIEEASKAPTQKLELDLRIARESYERQYAQWRKDKAEYLDEYGKRMSNMKESFRHALKNLSEHALAAEKALGDCRDWREPKSLLATFGKAK